MTQRFAIHEFEAAGRYLAEQGYMVLCGLDVNALSALKTELLNELQQEFGEPVSLENYHQFATSDEAHKKLQFKLFSKLGQSQSHIDLVKHNASLFKGLFGPDIDVQVEPYLRMARPNCPQDNIGLHRDTFYGNSAYEVSCSVNLTRVSSQGALILVPGSHKVGHIDTEQKQSETVTKGSDVNKMGFLYAPKVIQGIDEYNLTPVPLAEDEVLMFTLGVIHGQTKNQDNITRWSIDFRLKPSFAPVSKNLKAGYYENLFRSGLSQLASTYYEKMPNELEELTHKPL